MSLKDVRVRAPLWARERLPRGSLSRALFGRMSRPGHLSTPRRFAAAPRGRLEEDPQTPSRHRFPVVLAISRLSAVVPAFSRPRAPPRYPNPKSLPSGEGLGAQMGPSITPVTVFPLRGMVSSQRVYNILTKNNLRNPNLQTPSFSGRSADMHF